MSSASGIRAGRAYVEMYGEDDQLDESLQKSDQRLKSWGERLKAVGNASVSVFSQSMSAIVGTVGAAIGATTALGSAALAAVGFGTASRGANRNLGDMTTLIERLAPLSDEVWRFMAGGLSRSTIALSHLVGVLKAAGPAAKPLLDVFDKLNSRKQGNFMDSALQTSASKGLRSSLLRGDTEAANIYRSFRAIADSGRIAKAFESSVLGGFGTWAAIKIRRGFGAAGMAAVGSVGQLFGSILPSIVGRRGLGGVAGSAGTASSKLQDVAGGFGAADKQSRSFFAGLSGKALFLTGISAGLVGVMSAAAGLDLTTISSRLMRSGSFAGSAGDLKKRGNAGISDADVSNAKQLSNAMEGLFQAGEAAWAQVGAAVAPLVTQSLQATTQWVAGIAQWLNANRDLTASLFGIVKTVLTVGTAATIGGKAWTLLAPVVSALMPIFAAILSPVGLLAAGFLAAVAAVSYFSGAAGQAISWLGEQFNSLNAYFGDTWSGIVAAVSSGDLSTAGEIAMLGIRIAFADAMNAIGVDWAGFTKFFIDLWDTVTSNIARLFADPWNTIQNLWINGMTGMLVGWHRVMQGVMDAFSIAKGFLSKGILALLNLLSGEEITMGFDEIDAQTNAAIDENAQRRGEAIDKVRQDSEQMLGELDAKRNDRSKQIDDELNQRRADRDQALKDSRAKDQSELQSLRDRLGQAIDRANDSKAKPFEAVLPTEAGSSLKTRIAGAVNAAAISGIGPSSAVDQIAKHTKATAEGVVKLTKKPPLQPLAWGS